MGGSKKVKQTSISLENKPGNLARFCQSLTAVNVNIIVISVLVYALHNDVRMIVDNPSAALRTIDEWCLAYDETDVLLVDLPESNSVIAELVNKPAMNNINVDFTYISVSPDGEKSYIVIGTPNFEATMRVLSQEK